MSDAPPTAAELRALLAHLLAGAAGGTEAEWSDLIGEIEVMPIWMHAGGNWRPRPTGTKAQREAIDQATAIVASEHPFARA